MNVSAQLGQPLGPLFGAGLVAFVGDFWLLFIAAVMMSAVGAIMTYGIRVRSSPNASLPWPTFRWRGHGEAGSQ